MDEKTLKIVILCAGIFLVLFLIFICCKICRQQRIEEQNERDVRTTGQLLFL